MGNEWEGEDQSMVVFEGERGNGVWKSMKQLFMGGFEGWEEVDCFQGGVYGGDWTLHGGWQ